MSSIQPPKGICQHASYSSQCEFGQYIKKTKKCEFGRRAIKAKLLILLYCLYGPRWGNSNKKATNGILEASEQQGSRIVYFQSQLFYFLHRINFFSPKFEKSESRTTYSISRVWNCLYLTILNTLFGQGSQDGCGGPCGKGGQEGRGGWGGQGGLRGCQGVRVQRASTCSSSI